MVEGQTDASLFQAAERRLRRLSPERLRVAADFLAYLEEREADEATQELLNLPSFTEHLERAAQQAEAGQVVSFKSIRRDV
jgi:hypothetical protein